MKYLYIISVMILFSCGHNTKKEQNGAIEIQNIESDSIIEEVVETVNEEVISQSFEDIIASLKTKSLPLIETTNFDSFIEPEDYKNFNHKALSLDKIYPNFNEEGYNFRAISACKLEISDQFYSLVVTIQKGDNEMETQLINYDLNGNLIDYKVVSYDEIAEGLSAIHSKITRDSLIRNHFFYEEEEFEQDNFQLLEDGNIGGIASKNTIEIPNMPLIHLVLHKIGINLFNVKTNLIVSKPHPDNPDDVIIVIPEIVDEGEEFYELNSHILIINGRSGEEMHTFFESYKTNGWTSDAIRLDNIEIDTAAYLVKEDSRAFGITSEYFGSSRVNPYYNKTLSLFIKSGDSLKKVLHNFSVEENTGEWNGACEGEHLAKNKTLIMSSDKTNDFFDITVKTNIVKTIDFKDDNGDCDYKEAVTNLTSVLKYIEGSYSETIN